MITLIILLFMHEILKKKTNDSVMRPIRPLEPHSWQVNKIIGYPLVGCVVVSCKSRG